MKEIRRCFSIQIFVFKKLSIYVLLLFYCGLISLITDGLIMDKTDDDRGIMAAAWCLKNPG